jgi:hypothetical protein
MAMGFNNQIYLVTYYNEMMSKINNKNVEIKNYTTNVEQNYLINAAYKKDVVVNNQTAGQINVNIMNLKNIIAPDAVVEAFENA